MVLFLFLLYKPTQDYRVDSTDFMLYALCKWRSFIDLGVYARCSIIKSKMMGPDILKESKIQCVSFSISYEMNCAVRKNGFNLI